MQVTPVIVDNPNTVCRDVLLSAVQEADQCSMPTLSLWHIFNKGNHLMVEPEFLLPL